MYLNTYYEKSEKRVHIWDDQKGYFNFVYSKSGFKIDPNGKYQTLDGHNATRVSNWTAADEKSNLIYESDVDPMISYLVDEYLNEDDPSPEHNIMHFDIEVEKDIKYSTPEAADNTINAITAYCTKEDKYYSWILDKENQLGNFQTEKTILHKCNTEEELLISFIEYWASNSPTIVTGWNIDYFDIPYLINRIRKVLNKEYISKLSPIGIVKFSRSGFYEIAGVSILDYIFLYKKFNQNEEPSYKLNAISLKELNEGKVEYTGDLQSLYENDIHTFIDYSIKDVWLTVNLDNKLKFIDLVLTISHQCHTPYHYIRHTSFYLDGAVLTFCRRKGIVLPNKKFGSSHEKAEGAFVKLPRPGIYKWVYDLDLKALYPSTIQSYNISPETKMGMVVNWDEKVYFQQNTDDIWFIDWKGGEKQKINSVEFKNILEKYKLLIASNGAMYRSDKLGILPEILLTWANERDDFKDKMKEFKRLGDSERTQYYNARQWAKKIQSNSLYGVLLLPSFRFYDKENGEAITISSQSLIHFTGDIANIFYHRNCVNEYPENYDFCLYSDTDSAFFAAQPLIRENLDTLPIQDAIDKVVIAASKVQNFINTGYDIYARNFHNCYHHYFKIKQEVVSRRVFWGNAKKRYAQAMVLEEGVPVDKLDVKGFDSVRSDFPKLFRKFLEEIFIAILDDCDKGAVEDMIIDFKENMKNSELMSIMIPTSVKELSKFESTERSCFSFLKGTPIHCKSALAYNDFIELRGLNQHKKIEDLDKIMWVYLMQNPYNLETIGISVEENPKEIIDFVEKYIDKEAVFNRLLLKKLKEYFECIGWSAPDLNKKINTFF